MTWLVMGVVLLLFYLGVRRLKHVPGRGQLVFAEIVKFYGNVADFVLENYLETKRSPGGTIGAAIIAGN